MTNDWNEVDAENKKFYEDGGKAKRHAEKIKYEKGVRHTNKLFNSMFTKLRNKHLT